MSFKLTHPLPEKCLVAVSGGVDSMGALHWLSQKPGRVQGVVHVNHGTPHGEKAWDFVRDFAIDQGLRLFVRHLVRDPEPGRSLEDWWREQRYRFFQEVSAVEDNLPIIVAHHMDDCLEEYILCTMVRGYQGTIPYRHGPCIRPFRLWKKSDIRSYAERNNVPFVEDPSNSDVRHKRNFVRELLADRLKILNPGIYNIVEEAVTKQDARDAHRESRPRSQAGSTIG